MTATFIRPALPCEAERLTWANAIDVAHWCGPACRGFGRSDSPDDNQAHLLVATPMGEARANIGAWVVHEADGSWSVCPDDLFEEWYTPYAEGAPVHPAQIELEWWHDFQGRCVDSGWVPKPGAQLIGHLYQVTEHAYPEHQRG